MDDDFVVDLFYLSATCSDCYQKFPLMKKDGPSLYFRYG